MSSTRLEPRTESWENARPSRYLSRNEEVTASSASTKETLSSSGTRKSRSLAIRVSRTATAAARTTSFSRKLADGHGERRRGQRAGTPHGTKRLPSSEKKISSLSAAAHSMRAR